MPFSHLVSSTTLHSYFSFSVKVSSQTILYSLWHSSWKVFVQDFTGILSVLRPDEANEDDRGDSDSLVARKTERIPVKSCTKTFHEECHNEYKMVCEETFTEKEKYECNVVEETKCENGYTTEYEPACFQQI